MIDNPFMLLIICGALPKLHHEKNNNMTKYFILNWTSIDQIKRKEQIYFKTHPNASRANYDVVLSTYHFCMDLAVTLTLRNETALRSRPKNYRVNDDLFAPGKKALGERPMKQGKIERFFKDSENVVLAKYCGPVVELSGDLSFGHKTYLDYFTAYYMFKKIEGMKWSTKFDKLLGEERKGKGLNESPGKENNQLAR